ncbi:cytochrome P450 [Streptomyces monomycini]|uniref:cytochrome P450 n=1 Tax=Streptomyces monomycini TaxID=371720 RepID=UPI00067ADC42|nr:cytochrome P450 [Streptomyces monomycini]
MAIYDGEPIRRAVAELTRFLGASVDDPGFLADPHRCLTPRIRSRPVHRLPGGALAVLGHAACAEVLRDARFGHGAGNLYETTLLGLPARSFLQMDTPGHTRLRGQVARHFSVRRIQGLAQNLAHDSAALSRRCAGRPGDFVTDFAEPLAMTVISDVLGVPPEDRTAFHRDARLVIQGLDQPARTTDERAIAQARFRFVRYFRRQIQARRQAPREDLVSTLLHRPDGSMADDREVVTTCSLLLSAGYDTTVSLLSQAVAELDGAPSGQGWAMASNPWTADAVVEEVLRLQSPVQVAPRAAVRDTALDGLPVARGTIVLPLLAAANRDPDVFDTPHAFRPGRYLDPAGTGPAAARHLAFGAGAHFCLGAALARATARGALSVLAACPPRLNGASRTYHEGVVVRGLRSLPVTWPGRPSGTPPSRPAGGAGAHAAPSCPVAHPQRSST